MEPRGSIVYLHGVGGVRPDWAAPLVGIGDGIHTIAPSYADLLRADGDVDASGIGRARVAEEPTRPRDAAAVEAYRQRQRDLGDLVRRSGDALPEGMAWPSGLPRPGDLSSRLPLASLVRTSLFGLDQVGRYLDDPNRRRAITERVIPAVLAAPRPRVILGHSLGSIVALDVLADERVDVDLLVTLGSPLGHEAIHGDVDVLDAFPYDRIGGWLNVVHLLDPVPLGRGLHPRFPAAHDAFVPMITGTPRIIDALPRILANAGRALTAHLDSTYLATDTVRVAIGHAWQNSEAA